MLSVTLTKRFPGFTLDVSWEADDRIVALFGPSGAGKSLTLGCLAGLVRPDTGRIVVNGRTFDDVAGGVHLPPQARRLGYVFQGYALFPHLTVAENVAFGLPDRPPPPRPPRRGARGGGGRGARAAGAGGGGRPASAGAVGRPAAAGRPGAGARAGP